MSSAPEVRSRRVFLAGAAACCAAPLARARHFLAHNPTNVYLSENGQFGQDKFFSTGLLIVTNPRTHLRRIQKLRKQYNYLTNFRYSINDRYRFNFVRDVITAELNDPDTRYVVRTESLQSPDIRRATKVGSSYPYQFAYQDLFQRSLSTQQRLVVHAVNRTSRGDDRYFYSFLAPMFPNLADFYLMHYWENDLLQLANFFTGCVHRDLNDTVDPDAGKVKERLVLELKRQLGITSFASLAGSQKFQVIMT